MGGRISGRYVAPRTCAGPDKLGEYGAAGPSLALWLDASDAATFTLSGSEVTQWNDKSGNSRHASQGTSANRPLRNGTLNGLSTVVFDGSNDFLTISAGLELHTMLIVGTPNSSGANKVMAGSNRVESGIDGAWYVKAESPSLTRQFHVERTKADNTVIRATVTTQYTQNTPHIFVVRYQLVGGTTHSLQALRDGLTLNGGNTGTGSLKTPAASMYLGCEYYNATTSSFFTGAMAEVIMYGVMLDDAQLTRVINYLKTKWAI